jgi:hypothetical protein
MVTMLRVTSLCRGILQRLQPLLLLIYSAPPWLLALFETEILAQLLIRTFVSREMPLQMYIAPPPV